jgi:hypothetical protein
MVHTIQLVSMVIAVVSLGASVAQAKAPTSKSVVTGPGIHEPVELTHGEAISANVWHGSFMSSPRRMVEPPSPTFPRYTIEFYAEDADGRLRNIYAVYYVWDSSQNHALVQIPEQGDRWYELNVSTISRCCAGQWFYASDAWADAIRPVLPIAP